MSSSPRFSRTTQARARGFTIVEILVAASLGSFVLAGVLTANLQVMRNGVRAAEYAEMDAQIRRGLDYFGRDVRAAFDLKWNGESDLTLTVPTSATTTAQVTYAWTATGRSFYRVAGANSAQLNGRLELIRGIPSQSDGTAGLKFQRRDLANNVATTDAATKRIVITLSTARTSSTTSEQTVSAIYVLRNKPPS